MIDGITVGALDVWLFRIADVTGVIDMSNTGRLVKAFVTKDNELNLRVSDETSV